MAGDRLLVGPSTPELASIVVVASAVALPLAVLGLSTVTGVVVGPADVFEHYWLVLALAAVGSVLVVPFGAVLGLATLPLYARTDLGFGPPAAEGRFDPRIDHVAGAVLYAWLATFSAGVVLSSTAWFSGSRVALAGVTSPLGAAALLAGAGIVAATFFSAQVLQYRERRDGVDRGVVAGYALYAAALLPAPIVALAVVDLLVVVDLWTVAG